jgi:hypothetical protein
LAANRKLLEHQYLLTSHVVVFIAEPLAANRQLLGPFLVMVGCFCVVSQNRWQ